MADNDKKLRAYIQELEHLLLSQFLGATSPDLKQVLYEPFGAMPQTSAATTAEPDLTLADFTKTIEDLKRLFTKPLLRAVWFVDCPGDRVKFEKMILDRLYRAGFTMLTEPDRRWKPAIYGVEFFDWSSSVATRQDLEVAIRRGLWFVLLSGIWMEMSDGQHKKVIV